MFGHEFQVQICNRQINNLKSTILFFQEVPMDVEYTGRHYEVTPAIRKSVETGLAKIRKILGDKFDSKVILAVEKHRHKAEITISPRNGPIVGLAQSTDMKLAVNEALGHIERQAVKYKTRIISKKSKSNKKGNAEAKGG